MPTSADEARLEQSKMSFGEHLEELRSAIIKSLLALTIGFIVGLLVGGDVVEYIQGPLRTALEKHYVRQLELAEKARLEGLAAHGEKVPEDIDAAAKKFAAEKLVPHEMYLDPRALAAALKESFPNVSLPVPKVATPAGASLDRSSMIKLQVYQPLAEDPRMRIVGLGVEEPFVVYIKASLGVGLVLASPFVFYFLWSFIAAGLYRHEQKYVYLYLPLSLGLFLAGAGIAFYFAFDYMLAFLFWFFERTGVEPDPRLSYWLTLVLLLPLAFGAAFQLPIIMLAIERLGIVSIEAYTKHWRMALLIIWAAAMIITPGQDPQSMILLGLPLCLLYWGGILLCRYMPGQSLAKPPLPTASPR